MLWPSDVQLHLSQDGIEVVNREGQAVARVGSPIRMGGGAVESGQGQAHYDRLIPGLPLASCPGPYWVAGQLETVEAQTVPDIYVDPFTSGGQVLALFITQSRPSPPREILSGRLEVDAQGCMRVGGLYRLVATERVSARGTPASGRSR